MKTVNRWIKTGQISIRRAKIPKGGHFNQMGGPVSPHMGQDAHFGVKWLCFISKVSQVSLRKFPHIERFNCLLLIDQFHRLILFTKIWASILYRVGVLSHVTLLVGGHTLWRLITEIEGYSDYGDWIQYAAFELFGLKNLSNTESMYCRQCSENRIFGT